MRIKLDLLLDLREVGACAVDLLSREFKASVYQKGTAMHTTVTIQCTDGGRRIIKHISKKIICSRFLKRNTFSRRLFPKTPFLRPSFPSLDPLCCSLICCQVALTTGPSTVYNWGDFGGTQHHKAGNLMHSYLSPLWIVLRLLSVGRRSHISKRKSHFFYLLSRD